MFNLTVANAKAAELASSAKETAKGYADSKKEIANKIFSLPKSEASVLAGDLVNSVVCLYRPILGEFLHTTSVYGKDKVDNVEVSVRSKLKSEKKYKYVFNCSSAATLVSSLLAFFTQCTIDAEVINMAYANIEELNKFIEDACTEAGVSCFVKVKYGTEGGIEISDSCVEFEISAAAAIALGDTLMFRAVGDISEYAIFERDCQRNRFINFLQGVQTPVDFLKCSDSFFVSVIPFRPRKRADRILREKYHKNYQTAGRYKTATYYLNEDVKIGGETVKVFALVNVDGENVTVVLSPFDVKTMLKVDFDVVSAVKAVMV